jgi:uncharacterized lipoprotein
MNRSAQGLLIIALVAILGACSTTKEPVAATHYWYSDESTSTREYNADNTNCEKQTQLDASGKLDPDSTSFSAYRDCMIKNGYSLRTYFF